MNELRCLIVGMGGITHHMLRTLQLKRWFKLTGVMDVRRDALAKAARDYGLPDGALFETLPTALEHSDAKVAFINTPSELHYEQCKAALEAGMHVLTAKPITNNYEQAVELVELAAKRNLKLTVGQQIRYNRHYVAVRRFLQSGQLGQVEMVNFINAKPRHSPHNLATMDQPALYEMSCHHFDSLLSLFPERVPQSIYCDGFRPTWSVYSGPCMINALIQFDRNLHVMYQCGFSSQADSYELRLEGTQGVLRCRGIHMSNDAMDYEFAPRGGKFAPVEIDTDIPTDDPFVPYFDIWQEYMQGGPEPSFSGRHNLAVFALLSAGIDSMEANHPIDVAPSPRYANAFEVPGP